MEASEHEVAVEVADVPVEKPTTDPSPIVASDAPAPAPASSRVEAPAAPSASTTTEPDKPVVALVATLILFLFSFSGAFVVGGVLISVGVQQANAACDFNFATFAVVYGSLLVVYGGLSLIAAGFTAYNKELDFGKTLDRFNRGLLAPCLSGVFIWGTVLAFSNNRWNDVMISTPASGAPCDAALYQPVAIIIIVLWSLGAAACFFACLFACCVGCCFGGAKAMSIMGSQSPGHALKQLSSRRLT